MLLTQIKSYVPFFSSHKQSMPTTHDDETSYTIDEESMEEIDKEQTINIDWTQDFDARTRDNLYDGTVLELNRDDKGIRRNHKDISQSIDSRMLRKYYRRQDKLSILREFKGIYVAFGMTQRMEESREKEPLKTSCLTLRKLAIRISQF
ncbi:hypothetical protein Tco_1030053 [Tanacetum coccineum]|uniref:Uncharacterized protein n=1 Tax=Tanacetum coccineum TaxID=301880 RepID=A0ABQ5G6Z3_9ASTR